jgi:DnaK suppressor protein
VQLLPIDLASGGVRAGLLAERVAAQDQLRELAADVADLMSAADRSNGDDEHDPEGATVAFERAQTQALGEGLERRIEEIDSALAWLAEGRYGECASCGKAIAPERLVARPSATRCVICAGRGQGRSV